MSEASQLQRMETKLDKLCQDISDVKVNQARDLQRFEQVDQRFSEVGRAADARLELHDANCEAKKQITIVNNRIDAITNQAKGARWASGKIWAGVVAMLVLADMGFKFYQALKD